MQHLLKQSLKIAGILILFYLISYFIYPSIENFSYNRRSRRHSKRYFFKNHKRNRYQKNNYNDEDEHNEKSNQGMNHWKKYLKNKNLNLNKDNFKKQNNLNISSSSNNVCNVLIDKSLPCYDSCTIADEETGNCECVNVDSNNLTKKPVINSDCQIPTSPGITVYKCCPDDCKNTNFNDNDCQYDNDCKGCSWKNFGKQN